MKTKETVELENYMDNFYGTENYYQQRPFISYIFTDGVKGFCEKAQAFWFLMEAEFAIRKTKKEDFIAIHLNVKEDRTCEVYATDGDTKKIYKKHIPFTDCPAGDWLFFYNRAENILIWHNEY